MRDVVLIDGSDLKMLSSGRSEASMVAKSSNHFHLMLVKILRTVRDKWEIA